MQHNSIVKFKEEYKTSSCFHQGGILIIMHYGIMMLQIYTFWLARIVKLTSFSTMSVSDAYRTHNPRASTKPLDGQFCGGSIPGKSKKSIMFQVNKEVE